MSTPVIASQSNGGLRRGLAARMAMFAGGKALPYDAEVEWLKSINGVTRPILLGYTPKVGDRIDIKIFSGYTPTAQYGMPFSASEWKDSKSSFFLARDNNNYIACNMHPYSYVLLSNVRNIDVLISFRADGVYVDGVRKLTKSQTVAPSLELTLFKNTSQPSRVKFVEVYRDDELIHDYRMVRVGECGRVYDKVSQTLYGDAVNGELELGDDVS